MAQDSSAGKKSNYFWFWWGLLALAVGLVVIRGFGKSKLTDLGIPLPELMAAGWLQADPIPSRASLQGKVVLIDCWATWCPPCVGALPELAQLYAKYRPLGVEFIGLTPEEADQRDEIEQLVRTVPGFDWPIGYEAGPTLQLLGIQVFPTVIVFSAQGQAIWSGHHLYGIEAVLDEALATAKPDPPSPTPSPAAAAAPAAGASHR